MSDTLAWVLLLALIVFAIIGASLLFALLCDGIIWVFKRMFRKANRIIDNAPYGSIQGYELRGDPTFDEITKWREQI